MNELDRARLTQALALAEQSIGLCEPNPRVGCVIGHESGEILGQGATQRAGQAHAEVMALRDANGRGLSTQGATAWVSLEPCAHHGRTPPCCDALIQAGLARVVVAVQDPYPSVAGQGIQRLRSAGIRVDMADAETANAAIELNIGFFSRVMRQRPWVRVKVASSMDGRTALPNGNSQWITGAAARRDGHAWRSRASAIVTGIGTVLTDNPRLDVRDVSCQQQPWRVVVDSRGRTPIHARLFEAPGEVILATVAGAAAAPNRPPYPAQVSILPVTQGPDGRLSLLDLLKLLAARGANEVHVEAGAILNGALAAAGLVDEWLLYLAPRFLGQGPGAVDMVPLDQVGDAPLMAIQDVHRLGFDLRLRLRPRPSEDADARASTLIKRWPTPK